MKCMATLRTSGLELAGGPYLRKDREKQGTIAQITDHDTEGKSHPEDPQETTLETTLEIDTDTEDTQTEVIAEKEEEIMKKTGTGRPAMAIKGDIERVARSPQVMGGLL